MANAQGRPIFLDTETNGEKINDGRGVCMGTSFAYKDRSSGMVVGRYFPLYHAYGSNLNSEGRDAVRDVIVSAPSLTAHNAKFDLESLLTVGIEYKGPWNCTMVWAHLLNENWPRAKSLDSCCAHYLGEGFQKRISPELSYYTNKNNPKWGDIPSHIIDEYATYDAINGFNLAAVLWKKMREEGLL